MLSLNSGLSHSVKTFPIDKVIPKQSILNYILYQHSGAVLGAASQFTPELGLSKISTFQPGSAVSSYRQNVAGVGLVMQKIAPRYE